MSKQLLGECPICEAKLVVSELKCPECQTKISGSFALSKFDYLSKEQQDFALVFIKNEGNIKAIEKELNISYPTVKKLLSDTITNLGFSTNINVKPDKETILQKLKAGEIDFDEAEFMIGELEDEIQ